MSQLDNHNLKRMARRFSDVHRDISLEASGGILNSVILARGILNKTL